MILAKRYTGSLGKAVVGVKPSETVVTPIVAQCQDDSWIPTCEECLVQVLLEHSGPRDYTPPRYPSALPPARCSRTIRTGLI